MRLRNLIICVCFFLVGSALLVGSGMQLDSINAQRKEMKLVINEPLKNAPPSLAFATVAMGAFRGLVVDVLWLRADALKQEGQFFDAKQLAEWITILQPRFPTVWEFHAWNMAYNISVCIPATQPEERWRWVKNGYELLRDKGIEVNPKSILLYRELARIFQHKIGGITDDAHKYYKLQLAADMERLLDEADNQKFIDLAQTPKKWQQIIDDSNVAAFVIELETADEAFADQGKFVSKYLSLRENPDRFDPAAFKVIDKFRGSASLRKFDLFAKAYQLRHIWKLEPDLMLKLNQTYGPVNFDDPNNRDALDWRHPDTHAIYWAVRGLEMAGKQQWSSDESNTDRIVAHSLQNLFRNGTIFIYDIPSMKIAPSDMRTSLHSAKESYRRQEIYLRPNLRMFDSYNKSIMATLEKYKELKKSTYIAMQNGHRNMLKNAVFLFYQAGHMSQAVKLYKQLREQYPRDEFKVPLNIYVKKRLRYELEDLGISNATEMIMAILRESYFRYAMRNDDEAFGREKLAKEAYDLYNSLYFDENSLQRINLPEFKRMRYIALMDFLNDKQYPAALRKSLFNRIEIERPELFKKLEKQREILKKQSQQKTT